MSKTKFTPGPWRIENIIRYAVNTVDKHIAMVSCCTSREKEHEENEANAHLIAAAPDLYEALERIESNPCLKDMNYYTQEAVKAALAKARGEA